MPPKKYHNTTIDCTEVRPFVKELVDRCGSPTLAAEYALVSYQTVYRILNQVNCTVQRGTAQKLVLALKHRREEDRQNHQVHERLLKARQQQARLEENMERMVGY